MTRYGYHDMPDNYTDLDLDEYTALGVCPVCKQEHTITVAGEDLAQYKWQQHPRERGQALDDFYFLHTACIDKY